MRKNLILNLRNINLKGKKNRIILNHPNSYLMKKDSNHEFFLSDNKLNSVEHFNHINKIYEKNLIYLTKYLNKYHKVNFSKEYWRILIGVWLQKFISLVFDRWLSLKKVNKKYKKINLKIRNYDIEKFIPFGIEDFNYFIEEDEWNNYIYFELINNLRLKSIRKINQEKKLNFKATKEIYRRLNLKNDSYLNKAFNFLQNYFLKNSSNLKYYVFDTYRPSLDEIKINFLLNHKLLLFKPFKFVDLYPGLISENIKFSEKRNIVDKNIKNDFNNLLKQLCIKNIPKCYLEYYNTTNKILEGCMLPKKPRIIFSTKGLGGRHTLMDMYSATKSENGTKIVIAQHGGNYGQQKIHPTSLHESKISNKFLSWGFENDARNKPLGIIKENINEIKYNKNNTIILFETRSRNLYSHTLRVDTGAINSSLYLQKICEFFSNLKDVEILDHIRVKMSSTDYGLKDKDFMLKTNKNIKFINPRINTKLFYKKVKLIIHTFPGTGHLEAMASNVPHLLLNLNDMSLVKKNTRKYFVKFKKLGIMHDNPISLIEHLKKISKDPGKWWFSKKIQSLRKKYSNDFAIPNKNINRDIVKILKIVK